MGRNYEELRKKIRGKYSALAEFAAELGITPSTLSCKLKGKTDWTRQEVAKIYHLLDLTPEELTAYFFS